jgi:hypothetical protein
VNGHLNDHDDHDDHDGRALQVDEVSYAKKHLPIMFHMKKQLISPKINCSMEHHLIFFHANFTTSLKT